MFTIGTCGGKKAQVIDIAIGIQSKIIFYGNTFLYETYYV